MDVLKLSNLTVARGRFRIESVDLTIGEQDYLVIIGVTGSGKTTLLKTIAGGYAPAGGNIILDGSDVTASPPEKRKVVYVSQNYSLFNHMNVYHNIEYGPRARGLPKKESGALVDQVATELGVDRLLLRSPQTLSGGEQQMVALARALVTTPRVLLLDEPLSMVDPETRDRLIVTLKNIPRKYNCSVVHVTHDWDEAFALANKVAVLDRGRIAEVGAAEDIFSRPGTRRTAQLTGFQNIFFGKAAPDELGSLVRLDGNVTLRSSSRLEGDVHVCIRPEWIRVGANNGPNVLTGRVVDIVRQRQGVRGIVRVGETEITVFSAHSLAAGQNIALEIPPDCVHLISVADDHPHKL